MGKSKKRTPVCTNCCCKSQKRGKRISHRKFRRKESILLHTGKYSQLPRKQHELTESWDLGGDGKSYFHGLLNEDWYIRLMRK